MSTQPLNRWEKFMAKIAGQDVDIEPLNRQEQFYDEIADKTNAALTPTITEPSDGDVIKYDATTGKWVNGEGGGSGGGALVVYGNQDSQLDHTWQQIADAAPLVYFQGEPGVFNPLFAVSSDDTFVVAFVGYDGEAVVYYNFAADSADSYPVYQSDQNQM